MLLVLQQLQQVRGKRYNLADRGVIEALIGGGGGGMFIYSCSAERISFEISCF